MKRLLFLAILVCIASITSGIAQSPTAKIEVVNGKNYHVHTVKQKETLYGLSRQYGVSVDEIKKANGGLTEGLKVGVKLMVPVKKKSVDTGTKHKVKSGETLYSIARTYDVSIKEISQWNNLVDGMIKPGQELTIKSIKATKVNVIPEESNPASELPQKYTYQKKHKVEMGETLYSISKKYGVSFEDLRKWNNLEDNAIKPGQALVIRGGTNETSGNIEPQVTIDRKAPNGPSDKPEEELVVETASEKEETVKKTIAPPKRKPKNLKTNEFGEVLEEGLATVIPNTSNTRKYLALHKTAKAGTILRVRNELNNQEVFVRVLGQLPDTSENDKLLIKISQAAYNRLGAIDERFRVQIAYIP